MNCVCFILYSHRVADRHRTARSDRKCLCGASKGVQRLSAQPCAICSLSKQHMCCHSRQHINMLSFIEDTPLFMSARARVCMSLCICLCVYMRMCAHVCVCECACVGARARMCVSAHVCESARVCVRACIRVCTCVCESECEAGCDLSVSTLSSQARTSKSLYGSCLSSQACEAGCD